MIPLPRKGAEELTCTIEITQREGDAIAHNAL
jgi:hypothetical protein